MEPNNKWLSPHNQLCVWRRAPKTLYIFPSIFSVFFFVDSLHLFMQTESEFRGKYCARASGNELIKKYSMESSKGSLFLQRFFLRATRRAVIFGLVISYQNPKFNYQKTRKAEKPFNKLAKRTFSNSNPEAR